VYTEFEGLGWIRTHDYKLFTDGRFYDMKSDSNETRPIRPQQITEKQTRTRLRLQEELTRLQNQ